MVIYTDPNGPTRKDGDGSSGSDILEPQHSAEFDPDHPISAESKEDRLAFRSVANMLASSLMTQVTSHGLVVSIEGVWGSGKSSLVNLLADELRGNQERSPEIVRFAPWLVGNRDVMLAELMRDLASAVEAIESSEKGSGDKLKDNAKILVEKLGGYASALTRQAAPVAHLAGVLGIPAGEFLGKVLDATSDAAAAVDRTKPLPKLKEELTVGLRELTRRIVVIIDDLDRLEPYEVAEVMRLVRAVADFPNVIYVLCYDPNILARSLEAILSLDSGNAFLEKMVQVRFKVPQPEAFDLRRWVLEECVMIHDSVSGDHLSRDRMERLEIVCGVEGALLKTPRDVVRAANAIKLHWPPISDKVDFPDLVWLHMVKLENEDFYAWIEHYLSECVAVFEGASISEADQVKLAVELEKYLPESGVGSARTLWTIKEFLPGIRAGVSFGDKDKIIHLGDKTRAVQFSRDSDRALLLRV